MTDRNPSKPLGRKSYGSIGHLPGSRLGPGDHTVHKGQARICTEQVRDRHDLVIVTEKLDGSCMAVARLEGRIVPLGRAGYPAWTSPFEFQRRFGEWVAEREDLFRHVLRDGERLVGEWMYLVHGTIYERLCDLWYAFDLMRGQDRAPMAEIDERLKDTPLSRPAELFRGNRGYSISETDERLGRGGVYDAVRDGAEGAVWRVERRGKVDFLAKYVRPGKVDGQYLPDISGNDPVYHRLDNDRTSQGSRGSSNLRLA